VYLFIIRNFHRGTLDYFTGEKLSTIFLANEFISAVALPSAVNLLRLHWPQRPFAALARQWWSWLNMRFSPFKIQNLLYLALELVVRSPIQYLGACLVCSFALFYKFCGLT